MGVVQNTRVAENRLTTSLNQEINIEVREESLSVTSTIQTICEVEECQTEDLQSVEWRVWSEEIPRSVAKVSIVYSDSLLYIKWTRVVVEGEGIATILWDEISSQSNKKVFAKPVSEPMKCVANKLGFNPCSFDSSIVSDR